MSKLLRTQFTRLWKNKLFYLGILSMSAWAVIIVFTGRSVQTRTPDFTLNRYYFHSAPIVGFFCAIFTSLFLGTEYANGTIRNPIIVGHSRRDIYLSSLIVCSCAGLIFNAAWFIIVTVLGSLLLGGLVGSKLFIVILICIQLLMTLALTALFVCLAMLYPNRAGCAVVSIILALALLIGGSYFFNQLIEPEMTSGVIMTADGLKMTEPSPNPYYVSGFKRALFTFLVDFLPGGQAILIADGSAARLPQMMLYDVLIFLACTCAGLFLFRRKDIK